MPTGPTARRYTVSLDADSLVALNFASEKTGLDRSVIVRALLFGYTSGKTVGLPPCPILRSSQKRIDLIVTNGLRSI